MAMLFQKISREEQKGGVRCRRDCEHAKKTVQYNKTYLMKRIMYGKGKNDLYLR